MRNIPFSLTRPTSIATLVRERAPSEVPSARAGRGDATTRARGDRRSEAPRPPLRCATTARRRTRGRRTNPAARHGPARHEGARLRHRDPCAARRSRRVRRSWTIRAYVGVARSEMANLPPMLGKMGPPSSPLSPVAYSGSAAAAASTATQHVPPSPGAYAARSTVRSFTLRIRDVVWRDDPKEAEAHWAFITRECKIACPPTLPEFYQRVERRFGLRPGSVRSEGTSNMRTCGAQHLRAAFALPSTNMPPPAVHMHNRR